MSDTKNNDNPTPLEQRRAVLKEFLAKKTIDITIEDKPAAGLSEREPSRIIQANADGTLRPQAPMDPEQINFRAYPDGTFCKYSEVPGKAGFLAICLNTSQPKTADVLQQVAIVKNRGVAEMICDSINCMMQIRIANEQAKAQAQADIEEAGNEIAKDITGLEADGTPVTPTPTTQAQ